MTAVLDSMQIPLGQDERYRTVEPFPSWWALEFRLATGVGPPERRVRLHATGVGFTRIHDLPIQPVEPLPSPPEIYRFDPVYLEDGYGVTVYLIAWTEPNVATRIRSLRIKIHVAPLDPTIETLWRLNRVFLPHVRLVNARADPAKVDDVAVVPSFRTGQTFGQGRLIPDPWRSPSFLGFPEAYPGDWYLPFFAVYNGRDRDGVWFVADDHGTGPFDAGSAFGTFTSFLVGRLPNEPPDQIAVEIGAVLRADRAPLAGPATIDSFTPAWTLLIESYRGDDYLDYYDLCRRYRTLVEDYLPAQRRGNPERSDYRPVPEYYRDTPLVLGPWGEPGRYGQFPAAGDLRMGHVQDIQRTFDWLLRDTPYEGKPAFAFHSALRSWEGPVYGTPGEFATDDYGTMRPKYRSLAQWAKTPPNAGWVSAYAVPTWVSRRSSRFDPGARLLHADGEREADGYCWDCPQTMQNVQDDILGGALGFNVGLDAMHFDGIGVATRCADRLHGHRGSVPNEQVAGIRRNLDSLHASKPDLALDQEVPVECLLDVFESCAGEVFARPDLPPFFRMIYGDLNAYAVVILLFGNNPQWGEIPLFDLHALRFLKDGGLPVVLFLDLPGIFTAQPEHDDPVSRLLRTYVKNYELLKTAFRGDLARAPRIEAPACGVGLARSAGEGPPVLVIDPSDPLIVATAFRYEERGRRSAAIVLVNWAQDAGGIAPYPRGGSTFDFFRDPRLVEEHAFVVIVDRKTAFSGGHACVVRTTLASLDLPRGRGYAIDYQALSPAGAGDRQRLSAATALVSVSLRLPAASMGILWIEPDE